MDSLHALVDTAAETSNEDRWRKPNLSQKAANFIVGDLVQARGSLTQTLGKHVAYRVDVVVERRTSTGTLVSYELLRVDGSNLTPWHVFFGDLVLEEWKP